MSDQGQKTEKPTPRRVEKARREGRFPVSREFVSALQFLGFVAILTSFGYEWLTRAKETMRSLLSQAFRSDLGPADVVGLFRGLVIPDLAPLLVAGGLLMVLSLFVHLATTKMGLAAGRLAPDFARLNPLARLRDLPAQNVPALFHAMALLPIFGLAIYVVVGEHLNAYLELPFLGVEAGVRRVASSLAGLLWRAGGLFLLFGVIDLFRQRQRYMRQLRMSKQEIREEMKEQEGNPQIKIRIRRLQRDFARRNMMKEIPNATAVVVNPTHFAVALRYRMDVQGAPTVVAKGKNYLALRIRQKAIEHQIPIVENPPLAQALYKSVDVGQEIPAHLYRAVAEILAYIFKLMNGRLPG